MTTEQSGDRTIKVTVTSTDRAQNSRDGNPRVHVHTNMGSWITFSDSQAGYQALNLHVGDTVELLVNDRQIRWIRKVAEDGGTCAQCGNAIASPDDVVIGVAGVGYCGKCDPTI
jgi:hypothetical protein